MNQMNTHTWWKRKIGGENEERKHNNNWTREREVGEVYMKKDEWAKNKCAAMNEWEKRLANKRKDLESWVLLAAAADDDRDSTESSLLVWANNNHCNMGIDRVL